jgi:predicted Fe-Mo cluster-binding NifX family protein
MRMPVRRPRSLKHEYEEYVEREIEHYKESVPRHKLLSIGDEAVRELGEQPQFALTELVLCEVVDKIIMRRLRIPTYQTWRRRCFKTIEQFRRPEHWGLDPESPMVRAVAIDTEANVLVAGGNVEKASLYFAANGCDVITVETAADVVERVLNAAEAAGLTQRVRGCVTDIGHWTPDVPLNAVVCTPLAFAGLSHAERREVIELLQSATADGGVHLVETIVAGQEAISLAELRDRYVGWEITVERDRSVADGPRSFLARKGAA